MSASTVVPVISPAGAGSVSIVATSSGSNEHYTWTDYEITATPATGYRLDRLEYTYTHEDLWDGGTTTDSYSGGSPTTFRETQNLDTYYHYGNYTLASVTAYFVAQTYRITAYAQTGGTVTGGGDYSYNTTCTVVATPDPGWMFTGWYENNVKVSSSASYAFTVSGARTLYAHFHHHTDLLVNSANLSTPARLVYDPVTNLLVADY